VDYDRDGKLDFLSGSYDPGEVFLFKALGKGRFAHGEMLFDQAGVPLVHHPEHWCLADTLRRTKDGEDPDLVDARLASFGSFPMPCDFDGDGRLDLLIGSNGGEVFLRTGVPPGKPAKNGSRGPFAATSVAITAEGAPIRVHSHADPFVADWDGDGMWDLVVGAGDGSVVWLRNQGKLGAPSFGAARELVAAKSATNVVERQLGADGTPQPGTRAQICVADYDGDGRQDLLVGDYAKPGASDARRTSYVWLYRRSNASAPPTPRR
jgi:hypothetical protein